MVNILFCLNFLGHLLNYFVKTGCLKNEYVENILNAFQILLTKQRHILELSADINDEGTNAQMSDYIREQEKLVWMYSAYLKR